MPAYTDQEKVEAYLDRELTDNEVILLDSVIGYVSNFISTYTSRVWNSIDGEEPEASEKIFDGTGKKELFINEFASLEKVEFLDSQGNLYLELEDDAEFITYPLNAEIKDSIYLRNYRFGLGAGRIKITAVWTSGEVPDDVIMVATALVAKFLSRRSVSAGSFKKESIEGYSYEILSSKESDEETKSLMLTLDGRRKVSL